MAGRVLIVEDMEEYALLVKDLLESEGITVDVALTGEAALKKIDNKKPDLILLDLVLPGISGVEVCSKVKNDPSLQDINIIVLSGVEEPEQVEEALCAGAEEYISKISSLDLLAERIREYLR